MPVLRRSSASSLRVLLPIVGGSLLGSGAVMRPRSAEGRSSRKAERTEQGSEPGLSLAAITAGSLPGCCVHSPRQEGAPPFGQRRGDKLGELGLVTVPGSLATVPGGHAPCP